MTNPDNIVRVRARNGGRASVYEANGWAQAYSAGILEGTGVIQNTPADMNVLVGGSATKPDVVLASNPAGYKIALDIIGQQAVAITAPASNKRISVIVAYTDDLSLATTQDTVTGSPASCGLIVVNGTAANSPTAPTDAQIRTAITSDGATGSQAAYCVLAEILVENGTTAVDNSMITPKIAAIGADNIDFTTFGTVLYSGDDHCPITLSDSVANYEELVIEYRCNNQTHASVAVYNPNNKDVLLSTGFNDKNSGFFLKTQNVLISGTAIDQVPNTYAREIGINGSTVASTTINNIWITKVTGYKPRI